MKTGILIFLSCDFAFLFFLIRSEKFQRQWDDYNEESKKLLKLLFFWPLSMAVFGVFIMLILPW